MKKNVKLLVLKSKTNDKLDAGKIRKIAARLTRAQLREYLMLLRQERSREKVIVETPLDPNLIRKNLTPFFRKRSKDKEIEFLENKELIGGLKIQVNDDVLDSSFKNILEKAI